MADDTSIPDTPGVQASLKTGVYCILNLFNGKVYVGSAAKSLRTRKKVHWDCLKGGRHHNRHLQAAWKKYGEEAFEFLVLEGCEPVKCIEREQHWIDALRATNHKCGYNMSPTAGSMLGFVHPPESRAKIAAKARGRCPSEVALENMSEAGVERWADVEERLRMIETHRERYKDPVEREKLAEMLRKRWSDPEAGARHSAVMRERYKELGSRQNLVEAGRKRGALWADPVRKAEMLRKRQETVERKKRAAREAGETGDLPFFEKGVKGGDIIAKE